MSRAVSRLCASVFVCVCVCVCVCQVVIRYTDWKGATETADSALIDVGIGPTAGAYLPFDGYRYESFR